jgi:hypothetical protein
MLLRLAEDLNKGDDLKLTTARNLRPLHPFRLLTGYGASKGNPFLGSMFCKMVQCM